MTSRRLSKRMQESVQSMKSSVCEMRGAKSEIDRSVCGAAGPRKRQRPERKGGNLVQDGD